MSQRPIDAGAPSIGRAVRHALLPALMVCLGSIVACSSNSAASLGTVVDAGGPTGGSNASGGAGGNAAVAGGNMSGAGGVLTSGGTGVTVGGQAGTAGAASGGAASIGGSSSAGASGGLANGGGGGSAGGSGYHPCPTNGDPCKILPLGDSITWGIQYEGAYRVELFNKAVAAQQKITFTGSLSNGPSTVGGVAFPKSNEGHSGWTIAQDAGLVPSPAFAALPNIVLLMIGTNDIYAPSGQAQMPQRLGALMDKIFDAAPAALLVVAKITPLANAGWNAAIKTYNDAIPGLVQSRAAAGKHVLLADMNTGFTSSMLSTDTIHPNQSGYNFMGNAWYSVISDLLPK